jgi:hypothetical protein
MVNNAYFWDVQIFQKFTSHPTVLGDRRLLWAKFHTEDPVISGTTIQNFVTWVTWHLGIVHHWPIYSPIQQHVSEYENVLI